MKGTIVCLLALALAGFWVSGLGAEEPVNILIQGPKPLYSGVEMEMLILEGIRDTSVPPAKIVTSSFLKFLHFMSIQSEEGVGAEQQIRQVFNLKNVKLINAVNLRWDEGKSEKAFHIFRLDSKEYLILVTPGRLPEPQQFHIEVFEQGDKDTTNLLDMEFNIPEKNAEVFGFEDTQGKPYFLSFRVLHYASSAGRGVEAIPPKLVTQVDPVYPEIARQAGVQGNVLLEATTDIYGRVAKIKVVNSMPLLEQAAMDAVRQWVYEPMIVDGQPRPATFTITIRFTLDGGKGTAGGLRGGVVGGVVGGVLGKEREEFDRGAVRAVGEIEPPRLFKSVNPIYPEIARQAQVEGVVVVEARTDEKGNVEDARILRSIPLLDQAAIDAVKQWKYEPAVINGKPRRIVFTVTVRFMLKTGDKEKDLAKFAHGAVKAEGAIPPPKLIKSVDPVYPADARKAGVEGIVILAAKADATGKVQDVMILKSIPLLNQAAIDAVRQWVYEPMIINNVPTPVVFTVTVRFLLK